MCGACLQENANNESPSGRNKVPVVEIQDGSVIYSKEANVKGKGNVIVKKE